MQAQKINQFASVRFIVLAFALLAALLLASAAGYVIRGGTATTGAVVELAAPHQQAPDAAERNQAAQGSTGFKGPDAAERDASHRQ